MAEERIKLEEDNSVRENKGFLSEKKPETISYQVETKPEKKLLPKEIRKSAFKIIKNKINISRQGWIVIAIILGVVVIFTLIYFFIPSGSQVNEGTGLVNQPKLTEIEKFKARYGTDWQIELNTLTQIPRKIIGYYIDSLDISQSAEVNKDNVLQISRDFIKENLNLFKIKNEDLKIFKIYEDNSSRGIKQKLISVHFQQYYQNIPVLNSLTSLAFQNNKLVLFESNYYPEIKVSIIPKVTSEEALGIVEQEENLEYPIATIAQDHIYSRSFRPEVISITSLPQITKKIKIEDVKFSKSSLVIYPVVSESKIDYRLAWKIEYSLIKDPIAKPIFYLDAISGQILEKKDYVFYDNVDGYVTGSFYPLNPTLGSQVQPFENLDVSIESYADTTDSTGHYLISNLLGNAQLNAELKGPYVDVNNSGQYDAYHSAVLATPSKHSWSWEGDDHSYKEEESNIFYHTNFIHDFFTKSDPFDIEEMDYPVKANVGEKGSGNAFSDGANIYFFSQGDDCEATSLGAEIIYHEYTHLVTEHIYPPGLLAYGGESGAMHEGYSDYFAASILNKPNIGEKIFPQVVRNLNNKQKYPDDFIGEVHNDSLVFSGALWDAGISIGKEENNDLVIKTIKLLPLDFQDFLEDLLLVDDNDGNLKNGTPNITAICDSFYLHHGIYSDFCASYTSTAMANISSLKSGDLLKNTVVIKGTATGSVGSAFTNYAIEYGEGTKPIAWQKEGISLVNDGQQKVINNQLASWETNSLSDGQYTLRLVVKTAAEEKEERVLVEVDNVLPKNKDGWPEEINNAFDPQILDIDKDGQNELALMESEPNSTNSHLNTYFPDGRFKKGINITLDSLSAEGSFNIKDLNGDGNLKIIKTHTGYLRQTGERENYGLSVWDFNTGKLSWKAESSYFLGKGVTGPAVIADVDMGYSGLEIMVASGAASAAAGKGGITVFHANGTLMQGWPQAVDNNYGIRSSPAVGDIDHDGDLEIVAGGSENKIYAWHHNGKKVTGWPQEIGHNEIRSSPVLADLDLNGDLEIVVVLTLNEPTMDNIYIFNHDGSIFPGWPKKTACEITRASPAIGDLDKDGDLEIVVASGYNLFGSYTCPETGVYIFNHDGSIFPNWPKVFDHRLNIEFSPILVDIDGDTYSEILVSIEDKVYVFKNNGEVIDPWPAKVSEGVIASNLEVGDLDQDGDIEVTVKNKEAIGKDKIYVWEEIKGAYQEKYNEWPTFQQSKERTGVYGKCLEDGTRFGECNAGGQYCDNGILKFDCRYCGYKCPVYHQCMPDGTCFNLCKKTASGEVCPEVPFAQ